MSSVSVYLSCDLCGVAPEKGYAYFTTKEYFACVDFENISVIGTQVGKSVDVGTIFTFVYLVSEKRKQILYASIIYNKTCRIYNTLFGFTSLTSLLTSIGYKDQQSCCDYPCFMFQVD